MLLPILAAVSGQQLLEGLVWLIVIGLIFWLLKWLISYVGLPAPFAKVANVLLALVAVLFIINLLLGFAGHPVIRW